MVRGSGTDDNISAKFALEQHFITNPGFAVEHDSGAARSVMRCGY